LKLEEAILGVKGLKLELRKTDLEIDNIIPEPQYSATCNIMLANNLIPSFLKS